MKKIGFLILFVLVFSGCAKNTTVPESKTNSGNSIPISITTQTGDKTTSTAKKIKEEIKSVFEGQKIETGLNIYENKKGNFSLKFRSNRGFQENVGSSLVVFSRGGLSGSNRASLSFNQLMLADTEQKISLEEYYNQNKLSIRDSITDFTEISQKEIQIDGNPALEVIYKGQQDNQTFQIKQIFFQKSAKIFIITYLASSSVFSDYLLEIDNIINSFQIN